MRSQGMEEGLAPRAYQALRGGGNGRPARAGVVAGAAEVLAPDQRLPVASRSSSITPRTACAAGSKCTTTCGRRTCGSQVYKKPDRGAQVRNANEGVRGLIMAYR